MYRNFLQLSAEIFRQINSPMQRATVFEVQQAINDALNEIYSYHNWHFLIDRYDIPTVNNYTTGTVNVTQGSTTVVGVGTTWDTNWYNRKIFLSGDPAERIVKNFTSATTLELRYPYSSSLTTLTGLTYTAYQDEYPVPISPGRDLMIINPTLRLRLIKPERYTAEDRTTWTRFVGGPGPTMYTDAGTDTSVSIAGPPTATNGQILFKFFPTFNAVQTLILYFYKPFVPLQKDIDTTILPQEFEEILIRLCLYRLRKTYGVAGWMDDMTVAFRQLVQWRERDNLQTAYDYVASLYGYPYYDPYSIDTSLGFWPGKIG
jgi:hypothetical protein